MYSTADKPRLIVRVGLGLGSWSGLRLGLLLSKISIEVGLELHANTRIHVLTCEPYDLRPIPNS